MLYPDGQQVLVGDRVELWEGNEGVVVGDLDHNQYSHDYPREYWEHLGSGVLVLSKKAGLIYYKDEPEETMRLLARGEID